MDGKDNNFGIFVNMVDIHTTVNVQGVFSYSTVAEGDEEPVGIFLVNTQFRASSLIDFLALALTPVRNGL